MKPPRGLFMLPGGHGLEVRGQLARTGTATVVLRKWNPPGEGPEYSAPLSLGTPQRARVFLRKLLKEIEIAAELKRAAVLIRRGRR